MYLKCAELYEFFHLLKHCLTEKLGLVCEGRDSWEIFFLFCIWGKSRVTNTELCKCLISHARWAIKSRRNMAHYEKTIIPVWAIFKNVIQTQIKYKIMRGTVNLTMLFTKNKSLFMYKEGGKIVWNL